MLVDPALQYLVQASGGREGKAVLAADRLSANLARMLDERAIDEEVLEQMKADFFNLTLNLRSVPASVIWRSLETFT